MGTMTNKFCATTAIEIALTYVMTSLNIVPGRIIGHSFGEIAAAYADGCLTTKEALLVTYYRGVVTERNKKIPRGLIAVCGLSWDEARNMCPKGVGVVCNNGKDTVSTPRPSKWWMSSTRRESSSVSSRAVTFHTTANI